MTEKLTKVFRHHQFNHCTCLCLLIPSLSPWTRPQKSLAHAHSITAETAQLAFPPRSAIAAVPTVISAGVDFAKTVPLGAEKKTSPS